MDHLHDTSLQKKTRPSKQYQFCNYPLDKSLISQSFQSGLICQSGPGCPGGPSSGQGGQGGQGDPVGQGGYTGLQGPDSPCGVGGTGGSG